MRASLVTALLVLSVSAAACSSEEPDAGPTLPPVTAAPSPTAEPVPSEATEATPEGAAEFVRFFYAELERAYLERDPAAIEPLVTAECETCTSILDAVRRLQTEGATVAGYSITVDDAAAPTLPDGTTEQRVTTAVSFSEFVRKDAAGNETVREAPVSLVQEVSLIRQGDSWVVSDVVSQ